MKLLLTIILPAVILFGLQVYSSENKSTMETSTPEVSMENEIKIIIGSTAFIATLDDNRTAEIFKSMLPLTLDMNDLNSNEKYGNLSKSLPTAASNPKKIENGDLMLYGSKTIVIFYKSFPTSYSYTRLGKIKNASELQKALGDSNITITFEKL